MNSYTKKIYGNLAKAQENVARAVTAPVILNDETATKFANGLEKYQQMSGEARAELMAKTADELAKDIISKDGDGELRAFATIIQKTVSVPSHVLTNTLYANKAAQQVLSKDLHVDAFKDEEKATMMVNYGVDQPGQIYDLGWTQVFNRVGATNSERIKMISLGLVARFLEYKSSSDDLNFESFGDREYGELGRRFFASAFKYSPREMRFNAIAANEFLTAIRDESVRTLGKLANRAIFNQSETDTFAFNSTLSGATAGSIEEYQQGILNTRLTLSDSRLQLLDNANGVERGSKRNRSNGAKNMFSPTGPIMLFHNYAHERILGDVFYNNTGVDTTKPTVYGNIVPISTADAPYSGKWKETDLGASHDEMGFFQKVEEGGKANKRGGMLVIPGGYNTLAIFRELTILNETKVLPEIVQVAAKMEANAAIGENQKLHVELEG